MKRYMTELGTQVTETADEIVLETPDNVVEFPREDLSWLMHDVCSTPYAEVRS